MTAIPAPELNPPIPGDTRCERERNGRRLLEREMRAGLDAADDLLRACQPYVVALGGIAEPWERLRVALHREHNVRQALRAIEKSS